jgi:rhodanese-related sulfurtransferase
MNTREKFSVGLVSLGLILTILPSSSGVSFTVKPQKLLSEVLDENTYLSVDQVARYVVTEDSTIQLIDLRTPDEFMNMNIPGSINIPYNELLEKDPGLFLRSGNAKNVFYSNGDLESNYAFTIAKGINYQNVYVMKGGLNEWYKTIMNSSFTGERITPRENALFEIRSKAKKLFSELNSLPDSLKLKFIEAKHSAAKKLDGGCE